MGRPGRGGGSGGRPSGGHSPSRSSGGHRMTSGRPKSGGSSRRPGGGFNFGSIPPKPPRRPTSPPRPYRPPTSSGAGDFVAGMFVGSQMEKNRTNNNTNTGTSQASNSTAGSNELMTQDELAVMDGGKCIFMLRGVRPFLSDKYDLTEHPNYKYTCFLSSIFP